MTDTGTSLIFRVDDGPFRGFTNPHANREQASEAIVVRELLQNAMDATPKRSTRGGSAAGSGRRIVFALTDIPIDDIPHIGQYEDAFRAADAHCSKDEPPAGLQVRDRIRDALYSPNGKVGCLVCADDGAGLGSKPADLQAIYGTGRSTKHDGGRGSVGQGHLTAFARSDLRYVLYAGRSRNGNETSDLFAGHAILAQHKIDGAPHHSDGFIRRREGEGQFVDEPGGERVPGVLNRYLPDTGTGSAVMLVGYDAQTKGASRPGRVGDMILSQAVRHFLVAFLDSAVELEYREDGRSEREADRSNMRELLELLHPPSAKKKSLRTFRTFKRGTLLTAEATASLGGGVRVWFRKELGDDEIDSSSASRVSVFRDGMWIEDNTPSHLAPRHFREVLPFDAVVDLASDRRGSLGSLVREAEGASHLKIKPGEITDKAKRDKLNRKLNALRQILLEHAEKADQARDHEPAQLRLSAGARERPVPKRRPPRHNPDSTRPDLVPESGRRPSGSSNSTQAGTGIGDEPTPGLGQPTETNVKAGDTSGLSSSCRPLAGTPAIFSVTWKGEFQRGAAGLRMILPSGTDQTSSSQILPEYLPIVCVTFGGRRRANLGTERSELSA